jgi:hypothetical protein
MILMKNLILLFLAALAFNACAHEQHEPAQHKAGNSGVSVSFDSRGQLWRVSANNGLVQVDVSRDLGKSFAPALTVNPVAQKVAATGEARPNIAIAAEGNIYVTWTEALNTPHSGYVWFARSINAGKSFEKAYIVHQDRAEITHRFDALNVAPDGTITVVWVDKRDAIAAKAVHQADVGAAIYYAQSSNQGASFKPEKKLAAGSCECCRIATTNKPDGSVVALWRHVFAGGERDHMLGEIPATPKLQPLLTRATYGHWQIDGCPHHGAALASGGEGVDWWGYHMAYFDGNDNKPGLYYSRMDGVAYASSPAKKFGNNKHQAGHPALLSAGDKVWLVWREIEPKSMAAEAADTKTHIAPHKIIGMFSEDGGRSWASPKLLASSTANTDYPQLLRYQEQVYLVWNTAAEGLRLIAW